MDQGYELAKLGDFLHEYNKLTEKCFKKCVVEMNSHKVNNDEENCLNLCAAKNINVNHKLMLKYQELQTKLMEEKVLEMQQQQQQQQAESSVPVT